MRSELNGEKCQPARAIVESPWFTTRMASEYLGLSVRTLNGWRLTGKGPTWRKSPTGTIYYRIEDLDQWVFEGAVTSETEQADEG